MEKLLVSINMVKIYSVEHYPYIYFIRFNSYQKHVLHIKEKIFPYHVASFEF